MALKFNCPNASCRQRIEVEDALAGAEVLCPKCSAKVSVPKSHDIKFTCMTPDCGQHLVVDVSEAGRFLKCPACCKPQRIPGDPPKALVPGPMVGSLSARKPASPKPFSIFFPACLSRRWKHEHGLVQWFFMVTLICLLVVGLVKIVTWRFKPWYPDGRDLVMDMPMNRVMLLLGVIECSVSVFCAWISSLRFAGLVLIWFACNWWVYRIGQWAMNQRQPIPAFGALGGALGIPETIADRLMMGFMFMVAMVSALIVWRQSQLELNVK